MHVRKKVAPAGNECYNVFFLIDFTFDSYVFRGGRKKILSYLSAQSAGDRLWRCDVRHAVLLR